MRRQKDMRIIYVCTIIRYLFFMVAFINNLVCNMYNIKISYCDAVVLSLLHIQKHRNALSLVNNMTFMFFGSTLYS